MTKINKIMLTIWIVGIMGLINYNIITYGIPPTITLYQTI